MTIKCLQAGAVWFHDQWFNKLYNLDMKIIVSKRLSAVPVIFNNNIDITEMLWTFIGC